MNDLATIPQQACAADEQPRGDLPRSLTILSGSPSRRTLEACERDLIQYRAMEIRLRDALAESEARLRQKEELIQRQELLSRESDHRLMNDLQMTISLLSLQSRASTNAEAAAQLAMAANRVSMIAQIHHRLHSYDGGVQAIDFRKFLVVFGHDFSAMLSSE
jgi:two-component sensor histidine kinase